MNSPVFFSASTPNLAEFAHPQECQKSRTTDYAGKTSSRFLFLPDLVLPSPRSSITPTAQSSKGSLQMCFPSQQPSPAQHGAQNLPGLPLPSPAASSPAGDTRGAAGFKPSNTLLQTQLRVTTQEPRYFFSVCLWSPRSVHGAVLQQGEGRRVCNGQSSLGSTRSVCGRAHVKMHK